jgi:hypothetical protein
MLARFLASPPDFLRPIQIVRESPEQFHRNVTDRAASTFRHLDGAERYRGARRGCGRLSSPTLREQAAAQAGRHGITRQPPSLHLVSFQV